MLQQISEQVGFNYLIELVPDENYGAENKTTGEWNGLVRGRKFYKLIVKHFKNFQSYYLVTEPPVFITINMLT